jgi:hypothetical protein
VPWYIYVDMTNVEGALAPGGPFVIGPLADLARFRPRPT